MKTRALLFAGVDDVRLVEEELPEPQAGELLLETVYTAISPGTELRCLAGRQENAPFPYIPGYSQVGRVLRGGPGTSLPEGTLAYLSGTTRSRHPRTWGGHLGHAIKPESDVYPLPDGLDPLAGSLAHLAGIAWHGAVLSRPLANETVAVIGLGPIGLLSARCHALSGARTYAFDLSPERVALARATGIEAHVPEGGLPATFARVIPRGVDIVVDSTGAAPVLGEAVLAAKDKPWDDSLTVPTRLVIQGSYAVDATLPYPHRDGFMKEVTTLQPRDCQPRDLRTVLDLMARGKLVVRDLIGAIRPPEEAPETYAALRASKGGLLTAAFAWSR